MNNNLSYPNLQMTDAEFDWHLENDDVNELAFNKGKKKGHIMLDGRKIANWSKARKGPIGFMNKKRMKQRQDTFWKEVQDNTDKGQIRIVTEGDSWFNYPTKLQEVIDHLFPLHSIFSVGYAGDWLSNIYKEKEYLEAIRLYRPDLFIISGGGNDMVGSKRMLTYLKPYQAGSNATDLIIHEKFNAILKDFELLYRAIFKELAAEHPDLKIICHGYDYPYLDGKEKNWIGKPLRKRNILDPNLQNQIGQLLIDKFNENLAAVANEFDQVHYVDCRNVVPRNQWKDELHPNTDGFKHVANKFNEKITDLFS